MSDLYTVHFTIGSEPSRAPFEFLPHAKVVAHQLASDELISNVHVTDEFERGDDGYPITVYEP